MGLGAPTRPDNEMSKSMKTLSISSPEALDAAVADIVRLRLERAKVKAELQSRITDLEKAYTARIVELEKQIDEKETQVRDYCVAHRSELFPDRKSRETLTAIYGFELTPWRVERISRKVTWRDIVQRLLRLDWGRAYIRFGEPTVDKESLLANREQLTPEQLSEAGICFARDEQFFIRPKTDLVEGSQVEIKSYATN